jgi:hypothetical protein
MDFFTSRVVLHQAQQFPKLDSIPNRDVVQLGNSSYMPGLGKIAILHENLKLYCFSKKRH